MLRKLAALDALADAHPETKVLDYHDVLLRAADVEILAGPFWLNDQVISFAFEYFEREAFADIRGQVLLISPALAFLLCQSDEDTAQCLLAPLLDSAGQGCRAVVLPVNDNDDVNRAGGGMHWSLLVFDCRSKQFMHFDSSSRNNARVAKLLARNAGNALGAAASGRAAYGEMDTPRQANGYDCGMYVICMVRAICEWIRQGKDIAAEAAADMSAWLTPKHVDEYRSTLLQCILDKVLQNK